MKKPDKVSVHEMSHAIIAHGLGQKVVGIELRDDDVGQENSGFIDVHYKTRDPVIISSVALAGHEADMLWYGAKNVMFPAEDFEMLMDMKVTMQGANLLRESVVKYLKQEKKLIFALARKLDIKRKMSRHMFLKIIREVKSGAGTIA